MVSSTNPEELKAKYSDSFNKLKDKDCKFLRFYMINFFSRSSNE